MTIVYTTRYFKSKIKEVLKSKYNKLYFLVKKINFDIQLAIGFIFWVVIWTICLKIIIFFVPQISIFQVQYDILPILYQTVGTIFISLFVFIAAEGMRDKNEKYKPQILLKESKLPTIIILFLLSIVLLPLIDCEIVSSFMFGGLIGFSSLGIYAVYRIISIISNATELWKCNIDLFMSKIKQVTKFAINIRLENQKLSDILNKYKNDYIRIWFYEKDTRRTSLKSKQEGTVTSMSLEKLEIIFQDLIDHRSINEREVSKRSGTIQQPLQFTEDDSSDYKTNKLKYINLYIKIGDQIQEETPLLSFNKQLQIGDSLKEKLQDQLNNLIQVERSTVVDVVRDEIEGHRDKVKQLIKENNVFQFEKYFNLYFNSVKEFLHQISQPQYGQYSYEESKKEMNSIPIKELEGWPPLIWLKDHIMNFFQKSIELSSDEIYQSVQWFPYHLIELAQEKNDHLIFREALFLWLRQLYYLSESDVKDKEKKIKDHVDLLKNYIIALIFSNIRESNDVPSKKESYAIHLLEIMKSMFECILKRKLYFLLNDFQEIIIKMVQDDELADRQSISFIKISKIDNVVFEDHQSYKSRKLQFLFGFGIYLEKLKLKNSNTSQLINGCNSLQQIVENSILTLHLQSYLRTYSLICDKNVDSFWLWRFFNMPLDMKARISNWEDDRNIYFLRLLSKISEHQFKSLEINQLDLKTLSHLESLAQLLEVDKLQQAQRYGIQTDVIQKFFNRIVEYQEQQKISYIGKMDLKRDKVQNFIDVFLDEFKKKATMRHLLKEQKIIPYRKERSLPIFSINNVERKDYFLKDTEELGPLRAREAQPLSISFSHGFIKSENKFLQEEIINKCNKLSTSYDSFKKELVTKKWNLKNGLILNLKTHSRIIREHDIFKIKSNNLTENTFFTQCLICQNQNIPFREVYIHQPDVDAIILNIEKLPVLEMFDPTQNNDNNLFPFKLLDKIGISIGIGNFSHNTKLMSNILKKPPEWLSELGDEEKQREYLTQQVNVMVAQGINLNWDNIKDPIGTYFNISDL